MMLMKLAILVIFYAKLYVMGAFAANGTILQSFSGASGPGYKPAADTTGAVGPNHVVDFADSSFMVHDKAAGKVVMQMTMSNFWMFVEPSNTFVLVKPNDPRMLYDTLSGRWFASCAEDVASPNCPTTGCSGRDRDGALEWDFAAQHPGRLVGETEIPVTG